MQWLDGTGVSAPALEAVLVRVLEHIRCVSKLRQERMKSGIAMMAD
jgi:hypothetical protein